MMGRQVQVQKAEAENIAGILTSTLEKAGWKINVAKSQLLPTQTPSMLGFELDLCEGKIFVNKKRVQKLHEHLEFLNGKERPCARELAKLTGYIISMSLALGPIARLHTRALYLMIDQRKSWYSRCHWTARGLARSAILAPVFRGIARAVDLSTAVCNTRDKYLV